MKIKYLFFIWGFIFACKQGADKANKEHQVAAKILKPNISRDDTIPLDSNVFLIGDKSKIAENAIGNIGVKFRPYIQFNDFEVPTENGIIKAPVKYSSNPLGAEFETRIREGYKQGINFSGHYCFIEWGCGSPCRMSVLIDVKTGIIYDGVSSGYGFDFKRDSRMIICNPPGADGFYLDGTTEDPSIFIWNERKKKFEERLPLNL